MRIGIMTFPNMTSYGAVLQMYGLSYAIRQLGADAEVIHYCNPHMKAKKHTGAMRGRSGLTAAARLYASNLLHMRQILGFRNFEKRIPKYPARPTDDPAVLAQIASRYSGIVCGSDQVWNPHITDTDISFFLNFCGQETKRISYAPSFGIFTFPEDFVRKIKPELERFSHLSVREPEGAQLLNQLLGKEIPIVLDPTFLVPQKDWVALEKPHPLTKEPYVLYFPVRKSASLLRFSRELARQRNARLIVVEGNFLRQLRNRDENLRYALDLSPEEWLYLVHHAQCVVTNSFHGAAFAIHYRKDFYLELSSSTNSRLEQLMNLTGLQHRVVGEDCAPWFESIDYDRVEALLAPWRRASADYLRQSIGL